MLLEISLIPQSSFIQPSAMAFLGQCFELEFRRCKKVGKDCRHANGFSEIFSALICLAKDQSLGIQAVSQAGRRRTVMKHVSEMPAASSTADLRAKHTVTLILDLDNVLLGKRLEKAGPTRAGMEFRLGAEQGQIAARTKVNARLLVVQERATERLLCPLRPQDAKPFRSQLFEPFLVGFSDAWHFLGRQGGFVGAKQANGHFIRQIPGKSAFHGWVEK